MKKQMINRLPIRFTHKAPTHDNTCLRLKLSIVKILPKAAVQEKKQPLGEP